MKAGKERQVSHKKAHDVSKPSMKYVIRKNVQFIGLDELHPDDQQRVKDIIFKDYITLERELKGINGLRLHFKSYEKGGKVKFSAELFIDAETKPITVNKVYSSARWDPIAVVHILLEKARKEIIHRFHTDTSWDRDKGLL